MFFKKKCPKIRTKKIAMPDVFVIIFIFLLIAFALSYFLPSGEFDRVEKEGVTQVDPNSFEYTDAKPATLFEVFSSLPRGLEETADIIFLILIVGGVVAIIEATDTINAGINALIKKTGGNYIVLIATFTIIFATIASVGVTVNGIIAFVPVGILVARSLTLDPIVAVAITFLAAYSGWAAGVFDPTATVLGQTIAELPIFSGYMFRIAIFVAFVAVTIAYVSLYSKKIINDPSRSLMGARPFSLLPQKEREDLENVKFSMIHTIIIIMFFSTIGVYLYGAFNHDWGLNELSAMFLILGVLVSILGKINPNKFVDLFMKGAINVIYGALVVGIARAVIIIMEDGQIVDSIVYMASSSLDNFSPLISSQLLYAFNFLFNAIITSGTGQASIVMPIMVPIGDMLDITRQTTFIVFKLGDAVTNILTPLSGTLMACLAIARVSFVKWTKFVFPLLIIWIVMGSVFITVAILIDYGPY